METLQQVATRNGYQCEIGPSGRWLRFAGSGVGIYVIEGAQRMTFSVIRTGEADSCEVTEFPRAEEAIQAALDRLAV